MRRDVVAEGHVRAISLWFLISLLGIPIGIGLREFKPWARKVLIALAGLNIALLLDQVRAGASPTSLIPAAVLVGMACHLFSARVGGLFTPEYQEAICLESELRPRARSSPWCWALAILWALWIADMVWLSGARR